MYALKAYGPEYGDKVQELRTETTEDITLMQEALGITTEEGGGVIDAEFEEGTIQATDTKAWCVNSNQVMIPNRMKGCKGTGSDLEGLGPVRLDPNSDFT